MYSHSSANVVDLAKIGQVDVQIIFGGLAEIVKTAVKHKPAFGCCSAAGGLTRKICSHIDVNIHAGSRPS